MQLISGLGNPLRKYRLTRHNVGFLAVDRLAADLSIKMKRAFSSSLTGEGNFGRQKVILMQPLTFMNLSGEAVREMARKKRIAPDRIMVLCDDVNLKLGKIRIRESGSSGGHNGLKSVIENLETDGFPRLRIGIRNGEIREGGLSEYVLENFSRAELAVIDRVLDAVSSAVMKYLDDGIGPAMAVFNGYAVS